MRNLTTRLIEHVLELRRSIGRVDVDENCTDLGGRVLHGDPLGIVRAPYPDAVTKRNAKSQERLREPIGGVVELAVGASNPLMADYQRVPIGEACRGVLEILTDGLGEERDIG